MRARNIKPALFSNEVLAAADAFTVLTFIGLWGLADKEGRLEDRSLKIHLALHVLRGAPQDTEKALQWLDEHGFIVRYEVEGQRYIWIPKFVKHQRPHVREAASVIPPFDPAPDKAQPGHSQGIAKDEPRNGQGALNPDSGFGSPLNPENGSSVPGLGSPLITHSGIPPAAGADRQPAAASRVGEEEIEKAKTAIRDPRHVKFKVHEIATVAGVPVEAVKLAKEQLQNSTRRTGQ